MGILAEEYIVHEVNDVEVYISSRLHYLDELPPTVKDTYTDYDVIPAEFKGKNILGQSYVIGWDDEDNIIRIPKKNFQKYVRTIWYKEMQPKWYSYADLEKRLPVEEFLKFCADYTPKER